MNFNYTNLSYKQTGYFSSIIIDYLDQSPKLQPFYTHQVSKQGIEDSIKARQSSSVDRIALVEHLNNQYKGISTSAKVLQNIISLKEKNSFTITTAHQPALFTGTLYFIYKIIHTIKLADQLNKEYPSKHFVPIYWMGSEDADLDELGKFYLSDEKIVWDTKQTGAVGKMNTKGLDKLINRIDGELSVLPFGKELIQLLKDSYLNSPDIQTATFSLLNTLFAEYGLVILIPDSALLKRQMIPVFEDDLFHEKPSEIVSTTLSELSKNYKVQATPREINLFYLKDNKRERIVKEGNLFKVHTTALSFTEAAIRKELQDYPERFSPNVILRGLYQETILPNIAFIGGGGETAYWLELKNLFYHYRISFPILILRNSFLIVEKKWKKKLMGLNFSIADFFRSEQQLLTDLVTRNKNGKLKLTKELEASDELYIQLRIKAGEIDQSLMNHVESLKARTISSLKELEKKLLRAEKRKYEAETRQINTLKTALFPKDGLQERIENFMPYYAKWGKEFFSILYNYSGSLEQEFGVIEEND